MSAFVAPLPSITVLTSAIGPQDPLRDDQFGPEPGVRYVAYTDQAESACWETREPYALFLSPRRNSRAPKLLPHQFVATDYSLWLDARIAVRVSVRRLVDEWLGDADLAVYRHPKRGCIYAEAEEVCRQQLDDPRRIRAQAATYQAAGYPANAGLAECSILLRRHTAAVARFNEGWWAEYCRHGVRDQISFPVVARRCGVRLRYLDPRQRADYFDVSPRSARRELLTAPVAVAG